MLKKYIPHIVIAFILFSQGYSSGSKVILVLPITYGIGVGVIAMLIAAAAMSAQKVESKIIEMMMFTGICFSASGILHISRSAYLGHFESNGWFGVIAIFFGLGISIGSAINKRRTNA